jgi:hypothetical protein
MIYFIIHGFIKNTLKRFAKRLWLNFTLQLISYNFSLNAANFVWNFVVKFKSSYWNSQASL